jgi:hypothetical protein
MGFLDRLKHAWNAFAEYGNDPPNRNSFYYPKYTDLGMVSTYRPDRVYFTRGQERSLVSTVYNRIAIDVAGVDIKHVKVDGDERFMSVVDSGLNDCLNFQTNKDQTARAFIQDIVMSMFDEGCVAVLPIDTSINPNKTSSYDILTMRVGKILQWYPDYVMVEVYNDRNGKKEQITVPKKTTAIIENPLYAIMNEPNSVLQRLITKFNLLDAIDAQTGSGKLDLIVQLPYVIKTEMRRDQAEKRRSDIERQLTESKYGIAYTDGTEKITQLNRPVENNLMKQIEYLTSMLFSQLGITQAILDGTADEKTMLNYMSRTVKPILRAITEEMGRKFITKTGRSQGQRIMYFNNPFELIPVSNLADLADKFTRNEIMSPNEVRQIVGLKPVQNEKADELRNRNLNETPEIENTSTQDTGESNTESSTSATDDNVLWISDE